MFSRIYHFLKGPSPLDPNVWRGRLAPLKFRRFRADDLAQCLELYAQNEIGRFPKGASEEYKKHLTEQNSYSLVAEQNNQIIASGGISYCMQENMAVLCFGLVRPDFHHRGIGTALLLARLALLKPNRTSYHVFIFAVEKSIGFYRRFGFFYFEPWQDMNGSHHPSGHLLITSSEICRCRKLLTKHGISIPPDEDHIPFREEQTDDARFQQTQA